MLYRSGLGLSFLLSLFLRFLLRLRCKCSSLSFLNYLDLLQNILDLHSCEQDLRFIRHLIARRIVSDVCEIFEIYNRSVDLRKNLLDCLRHEGLKKGRTGRDAVKQIVEHCCQSVLRSLILCKLPRLCLIDILIASLEEIEYLCQRIRNMKSVHVLLDLADSSCHMSVQVIIDALIVANAPVLGNATEIFVAHGDCTVHEIAHCIGKLGVHALDHQLPGDDAVIFKRHLVKDEVTDRVNAENSCQIVRVDNIALGLAHLAAALEQPRMAEDLLRKRNIQRHKEDRPVNSMETNNILTDQMEVRRPVLLEALGMVAVRIISDTRDVVGQRIQPYIGDMLRIEIDRDAPCERCS